MTMLDPSGFELPPIPTKRYFAIGEVGKLCNLKPHVLRYWEQEFPRLKLVKRRGNRRYYQREEVKLIRHICRLLYVEGFTISGARAQLASENEKTTTTSSTSATNQDTNKMVSMLVAELTEVQEILT